MTVFRTLRILLLAAIGLSAVAGMAAAAPDLGPADPEPVRLNAAVTISGPTVKLGDLFTGLTNYQDKVVARAPRPGQRTVLTADALANMARTYGFDWRPADAFDRAVVFRPGLTITPAELLASVKSDLVLKGMPERFGLRPAGSLPTVVVPSDAPTPVLVRESFYDATTRAFTAVLELAGADGAPQFMQLRGTGIPTVTVPVLKQEIGRNTVITADMLETAEFPEEQVKADVLTDASLLIGKSPRALVQARRPIHDTEVARVTLVDVPVLKSEMRRDGVIRDANLVWTTMNAAELPSDVVTSREYLIGKSPRSVLAGGAPIRRGDVLAVRQVAMAVAVRDLPRGAVVEKNDINWVPMNDNELDAGAIVDESLISGRATVRPVRAGQALHTIDLTRPTLVNRGKLVTMIYATAAMKLTVQGEALEDGGASQVIRVANEKSRTTVTAEVIDANTVRVVSQQSAMQ